MDVSQLRVFSFSLLALASLAAGRAQNITVYPGPATIEIGASRQLSAYVPLSPNTISWSVSGVVGGSYTYGTITQGGRYTAPLAPPVQNVVTIRATSIAYPATFGTGQITITKPTPWIWSSAPATFPAGNVSLSLNGSNFSPTSTVAINNQPLTAAFVSSTRLKVTGNVPAAMAGTAQLRVSHPAPGAVTSQPLNVTVTVPAF